MTPTASVPHKPAAPKTPTTPTGSSIFTRGNACTTRCDNTAPTAPKTNARRIVSSSGAPAADTKPASTPCTAVGVLTEPTRLQPRTDATIVPAAPASTKNGAVSNTTFVHALLGRALTPTTDATTNAAPTDAAGIDFPGISRIAPSAATLPLRGPITINPTSAIQPPTPNIVAAAASAKFCPPIEIDDKMPSTSRAHTITGKTSPPTTNPTANWATKVARSTNPAATIVATKTATAISTQRSAGVLSPGRTIPAATEPRTAPAIVAKCLLAPVLTERRRVNPSTTSTIPTAESKIETPATRAQRVVSSSVTSPRLDHETGTNAHSRWPNSSDARL